MIYGWFLSRLTDEQIGKQSMEFIYQQKHSENDLRNKTEVFPVNSEPRGNITCV